MCKRHALSVSQSRHHPLDMQGSHHQSKRPWISSGWFHVLCSTPGHFRIFYFFFQSWQETLFKNIACFQDLFHVYMCIFLKNICIFKLYIYTYIYIYMHISCGDGSKNGSKNVSFFHHFNPVLASKKGMRTYPYHDISYMCTCIFWKQELDPRFTWHRPSFEIVRFTMDFFWSSALPLIACCTSRDKGS